MSDMFKKDVTVVLVHGAWADGSSWRNVIELLQQDGIPVVAVQNPTTSLADDDASTRLAINNIDGPVVLVGHSWGGAVITEAGNDPKVAALVYIAALAPAAGQSSGDQIAAYPVQPLMAGIRPDANGNLVVGVETWISDLAQDLPESDARVLAAVQTPLRSSAFGDKVQHPAWAYKPSWYLISTEDRGLSVELQRDVATKISARTSEVKASHLSILSAPHAVTDVVKSAVNFAAAK
jgi:pimeloyl-ACP methyl ester carboxylesterase